MVYVESFLPDILWVWQLQNCFRRKKNTTEADLGNTEMFCLVDWGLVRKPQTTARAVSHICAHRGNLTVKRSLIFTPTIHFVYCDPRKGRFRLHVSFTFSIKLYSLSITLQNQPYYHHYNTRNKFINNSALHNLKTFKKAL